MNPSFSGDLSLKEYYHRTGHKNYLTMTAQKKQGTNVEAAEVLMSKNSLKTVDFELFQKNLHIHLRVAHDIIGFYGTRNRARQRFKLIQNRQRFMSQIVNELVPDPKTIIALMNLNHQQLSRV